MLHTLDRAPACIVGMTEIGEVGVRRRRSRQEIKRLVAEFETSGLRRSEFCQLDGGGFGHGIPDRCNNLSATFEDGVLLSLPRLCDLFCKNCGQS
jgi:hypothetical protein